ncbi:MAG: TolC family protein [Synergistaceae bacterium]|nr:TolC family protein [Synergistaceae bacterium]
MKHSVRLITATVLLFSASSACAKELTVTEALTYALEHSPALNSVRQEIRKAKGSKVQADGNFYPKISINGSYGDGRYPTADSRTDSRSASVGLTQNLYAGGRHAAQRRQAKELLSQAELKIREEEEALAVKINTLFYSVLLARETVAAASDAVETSQKHVQEVRQMLRLGLANQLEVIRAEQQLSSNEASLASSRGTLDSARINLLNTMGLPPSSAYDPSGSLESVRPEGSQSSSLEKAHRQRADVAIIKKQVAIQKEQIKIAGSSMRPTLDLTASAGVDSPYHNQDRTEDSWKAALNLEIPVYDRGQTRGEVMKAKAVQEQNMQSLRQKELDIISEVDLAWVEINDSEVQVEARRKALSLAKETLRLSQVGYREGVTPQLDLLEAQSNLTAARKDYSQSLYNHLMRIVTLKRAEGNLVPWTLEGR